MDFWDILLAFLCLSDLFMYFKWEYDQDKVEEYNKQVDIDNAKERGEE